MFGRTFGREGVVMDFQLPSLQMGRGPLGGRGPPPLIETPTARVNGQPRCFPKPQTPSLRGANATKQSMPLPATQLDCFASARNDD